MGRVHAVPRLCVLYPGICLTTEGKNTEKPRVRVDEKCHLGIFQCIDMAAFENNRDEIVRVNIEVKAWLKRSLDSSEEETGTGRVRVEEQSVEGNVPKWRPVVKQIRKGETFLCQREKWEPWDGSDPNVVFQKAVYFL